MTSPDVAPRGLGRQFVGHDPRSRNYGVRPLLAERAAVERKPTFWRLPDGPYPLDQGPTGQCTGFGMSHELAAGPVVVPGVDEAYARYRYRRNQEEDRAMGNNFPEGATVLATMKAAQKDGVITQYRWAFGVDDCADTLCSIGPVCLGIDWYNGMFWTGPGGKVTVTGGLAGGHFVPLVAYDVHPEWGPVVGILNSWGTGWGVNDARLDAPGGVGWLTLADLGRLLAANGEAVVPADFFTAPTPPPPPDPKTAPFFASKRSQVFHRSAHPLIRHDRGFNTYQEAVTAGYRPCKICRPQP